MCLLAQTLDLNDAHVLPDFDERYGEAPIFLEANEI